MFQLNLYAQRCVACRLPKIKEVKRKQKFYKDRNVKNAVQLIK